MNKHSQYFQTIKRKGEIYLGIIDIASGAQYDRLTVAVAYATLSGCEALIDGLESRMLNWNEVEKRWIISFDHGLTQPEALVLLSNLPNSLVHIPNAEMTLKYKLRPPIRFHPKLYIFECFSPKPNSAIFSGSCNLTKSGLFFNCEQASSIILSSPIRTSDKEYQINISKQKSLIRSTFESATPLSDSLLKKYRALWKPTYLPTIEKTKINVLIKNPVIDASKAIILASAQSFWVKVTPKVVQNLGKGKPGNQIDLQRGSRAFFGLDINKVKMNDLLGSVDITFNGSTSTYNLRYGHNGMDKINLPPLSPPLTYADKTLLFTRNDSTGFNLTIGKIRDINYWRKISKEQNTLFAMKGGREFGVFD